MAKDTNAFVRKLAHNDASTREAAFSALKKFLKSKSSAKLDLLEMEKLWRGLYFAMWYCDKPIPQQNLAGNLGELFSDIVPEQQLPAFHEAFWVIIAKEWPTMDKWRLDKYLMLVRRVLRHLLFRLNAHGWPSDEVESYLAVLKKYPLSDNAKFPQSLSYHVCDIYLDEIEYVIFKEFREYSEEMDSDDDDDEEEEEEEEDEEDGDDKSDSENEEDNGKAEKKAKKAKLSEDEIAEKKKQVLKDTPLAQLIEPFQTLAKSAKNKALRKKCQEEVTEDDRLKAWGVVESVAEEDSEDEWTGF